MGGKGLCERALDARKIGRNIYENPKCISDLKRELLKASSINDAEKINRLFAFADEHGIKRSRIIPRGFRNQEENDRRNIVKYAREVPEAAIMVITPDIAREMLSTSPGNRKLRLWYVKLLAAAMRRGEWRVTSQGIGFSVNGELRDAHHRLNACIMAGVSFTSTVVFGLKDDAYQVIDTGMKRSYSDLLFMDKRVAEVVRLGVIYATSCSAPTIDQARPFIDAGFDKSVQTLIDFCGSSKKYFSSAPVKLAAVITIMNGGDADYVLSQYRALCHLEYDAMSKASQSFVRQFDSGRVNGIRTRETLTRALKVFDKDREMLSKIQISDSDCDSAVELVRSVLLSIVYKE